MTNLLNISIVTAWKFFCTLHEKGAKKISHLDFRRDIVLVLMKSCSSRRQAQGGRLPICLQRLDMMDKIMNLYLAPKADALFARRTLGQSAVNATSGFTTAEEVIALYIITKSKHWDASEL